jgi:hypothetical protein
MPNANRGLDGDNGFYGVDTRANPATLKTGMLQDAKNVRMDLQTLQVRKGIKRLLESGTMATVGKIYGTGVYVEKDGTETILLVGETGLFKYNISTGAVSSKYEYPYMTVGGSTTKYYRSVTEDQTQVIQAAGKAYILRGEATRYINGSGAVGQRVVGTNNSDIVTVTCTLPHGFVVGSEFVIETPHAELNGPYGNSGNFMVKTVISSTSFTYTIPVPFNENNHGAYVIQVAKPVLCFDGTVVSVVKQGIIDGTLMGGTTPTECDFPPTSRAVYHKNRIYCKYSKDEIAVSDYLPDVNGNWKFDLTIQALSVNQGDEQEIVGFYPYTRDEILVFKTNSIYAAKFADNTSSPDVILAESYVRSLTFDLGCVAGKSIANVGGVVFFLSSKGIYALEPQLDTNLLSNTQPLSLAIQKYIDRINQNHVNKSIGIVFGGRYYLGVPIDGNSEINHVFVYNINNKQWESIDTYPDDIASFTNIDFQSPYAIWESNTSKTSLYITYDWDANDSGQTPSSNLLTAGGKILVGDIYGGYFPYTTGLKQSDSMNFGATEEFWNAVNFPLTPESGVFTIAEIITNGDNVPNAEVIIQGRERTELSEAPTSDIGMVGIGSLKWSAVTSLNFQNLFTSIYNNERRLFTIDPLNGLFLLEEYDFDEYGQPVNSLSFADYGELGIPFDFKFKIADYESQQIKGYAKTRRYEFNSLQDKRFSTITVDMDFEQTGSVQTAAYSYNPDSYKILDTTSADNAEDKTNSFPVRKVAVGLDVEIKSITGRPIIRSILVEANPVGRNIKNKD